MNQEIFWNIWRTFVVVHVMLCDRLFYSLVPHTYTSKYFRHCLFWLLQQFLGIRHVLRSSILSLYICCLTTNILMLTCLYLWDMLILVSGKTYAIFIQFILTFVVLYFSNFLLFLIQNTSSKFVKYIC